MQSQTVAATRLSLHVIRLWAVEAASTSRMETGNEEKQSRRGHVNRKNELGCNEYRLACHATHSQDSGARCHAKTSVYGMEPSAADRERLEFSTLYEYG